jgi:hypothetical protein
MTAIGVDVAQGGDDMTVDAARQGGWYARLFRKPGKETREGSDIARMVVGVRHDNCPVIVDVGGGWGAAALGPPEIAPPRIHSMPRRPSMAGAMGDEKPRSSQPSTPYR